MKDVNSVVIFVQYFGENCQNSMVLLPIRRMEEATVSTCKEMDFRKQKVVMELN